MHDALLFASGRAEGKSSVLQTLGLRPGNFLLATVHRAENTDDPARLRGIVSALRALSQEETVVFSVHPRTRKRLGAWASEGVAGRLLLIEPVGYLDMVMLEKSARMILTDSGGIQKEAYWLRVPCLTLRDETEWVETVATGWNRLAGADEGAIVAAARSLARPSGHPDLYGDGKAAGLCRSLLTLPGPARSPQRTPCTSS